MVDASTADLAAKLGLFFLAIALVSATDQGQKRTFAIDYDNDTFVMDGKPFRYISGSIHYSRVPWQYWDDRLHKMAAAGLNAIQTYVPWNIHETVQGTYDFSMNQDIVLFLKTAQKYNLSVILRPGPYICAEWEFGGLPAWLLKQDGIKVRTMDPKYIKPVNTWLTRLYTEIKPMLYQNGGPIITVQIENEYGSYPACDYKYLGFLRDKARTMLGDDVVLFTTDGDGDAYLKCGTLFDVYATVDFGITYTPEKNFAIQRHVEPKGPLVNSEFYVGWLDHWGEKHSTADANAVAKSLDLMLALGANVNMYMFEGGTNFGFWNGANSPFQPVPTSYDYDGPLSEAGDITEKYHIVRDVITKYNPVQMKIPPSTKKVAYGELRMVKVDSMYTLLKAYGKMQSSKYPLTFEEVDMYYGYLIYTHTVQTSVKQGTLGLSGVRDRAYVSVTRGSQYTYVGVVERNTNNMSLTVDLSPGDNLTIVVENQGRINYGSQMNDNKKGFVSNVTMNGVNVTDWDQVYMSLEDWSKWVGSAPSLTRAPPVVPNNIPTVFYGYFAMDMEDGPRDTYLDMSRWTKGHVMINNVNIGRYWPNRGPQVRLYVPKHVLSSGVNNIAMFELETNPCDVVENCYIEFMDQPLINGNVTMDTQSAANQKKKISSFRWVFSMLWHFMYGGVSSLVY